MSRSLRRLRAETGLSQQQAAGRLGASLAVFVRWEEETAHPSPDQEELINLWAKGHAPQLPGAFASRGIPARTGDAAASGTRLTERPGPPILERVADADLIKVAGSAPLGAILAAHTEGAPVAAAPPAAGMSAGKNTYTYDAHTYHTKVPPQGIAELLKHYLPDGGLILDPFAGSGMTGVAASATGMDCILNELSPAGAFIASRFTSPVPAADFQAAVNQVLDQLKGIRQDLYTTTCRECGNATELLYTVWAYRVKCGDCAIEFQLWDHCRSYGRTVKDHKILTEFPCPGCARTLKKSRLSRTSAEPVEIGYRCCGSRQKEVNHAPDKDDLARISQIELAPPFGALGYPSTQLPDGVNLRQPKRHGLTSVDKFYTRRNLAAMSQLWSTIHRIEEPQLAAQVAFAFTGLYRRVTKFSEFRFWGGSGNSARLNVPYIYDEPNVFVAFARKARTIQDHLETTAQHYAGQVITRVGSATDLRFLPNESVDLVFTDPPFGANINYSDMNLLWEAWLGRRTDVRDEAIVNKVQGKDAAAYGDLMETALRECHRVLRPQSWMLLVFMNSSAKIWQELNDAVEAAGFLIVSADVFDKQHGTFKHFVSANTAGADLVLHCFKPADGEVARKKPQAGVNLAAFLGSVRAADYQQRFLHVNRAEEPDLRRLYSDWLSQAVVAGEPLMDFAQFRQEVAKTWSLKLA